MARVHPSAVIDPEAKLAGDVEVGPYAVIGPGVELASGVVVDSHVNLMGRTTVGSRTHIYPFAVIGAEPQIRGYTGGTTALTIGEDNVIREYASIHVGSETGGGATRIGDDNLIMNNCHIAHDCKIGSHCVLAGFSGMGGHVVIEDYVVFGGMTGVHQFVHIGESVFTAGNAMVSKNALPFSKVAGDRARFVGLNTIGLERRGLSPGSIKALKHTYHLLFQSKLRLEDAMERVEAECGDTPEVGRLLAFLRKSDRGFIR
jgi:UDP-N-acetylglucosamine acyltransferase